ncbi:hypothetical protein OHB26_17165 [Nocardia sp. NBC_01503]|uniref:hypothetical protein n=1 Tax=Nocardia sp. NBC_01503 TaxID=2975997 RepID=UPI002E7BA171|nr:hypothetical protein [Nocardia sp. NBC_01503]WTL35772.1 hypothetical protein OHB26_17165 [Nocardia sp. NBC_01503]
MTPNTIGHSVFGNVHIGYIVIETNRFADWRRFGHDAIGMHLDETLTDVMRFRLDDNRCRFLLQRGPAEDVTALGWHIDDHATFDEILSRVTRHGVPIVEGSSEEAALRGVERLVRFPGPNGLAQEVFARATVSDTPLRMANRGGFVTGDAGLGHVAIITKKPHQMRVGQHTNDKELSFYAVAPSGFDWEVGWNPIVVNEITWEPTTYQGISIWGHTPEGRTIIDKLDQFRLGIKSLLRDEDSVPALAGSGIPDNQRDLL